MKVPKQPNYDEMALPEQPQYTSMKPPVLQQHIGMKLPEQHCTPLQHPIIGSLHIPNNYIAAHCEHCIEHCILLLHTICISSSHFITAFIA